jgi:HNH endonuclease
MKTRGSPPGATHARDGRPYKKRGPAKGMTKKAYLRDREDLVFRMHCDHLCGMNLSQLERQYGYVDSNIKKAFERLGLKVKLDPTGGQFPRTLRRLKKAELVALAKRQTRLCSPNEIRWEWRQWSMKKRAWFVGVMRDNLRSDRDRPTTPFSSNVEPFDYSTPNARELLKAKNSSESSYVPGNKIKLCSQGVIWNNQLWFWNPKAGYMRGDPWTEANGRPILSHVIYESIHGPMPADGVIRFADGNVNNLDPGNLVLATRNDLARENQAAYHNQRSREKTAALLNLQKSTQGKGTTDDLTQCILGKRVCRSGGGSRNRRAAT